MEKRDNNIVFPLIFRLLGKNIKFGTGEGNIKAAGKNIKSGKGKQYCLTIDIQAIWEEYQA